MPMSNGDANAVNRLLRWITGTLSHTAVVTTPAEAREAAAWLADRAHRVLAAGITGEDVRRDWPEADRLAAELSAARSRLDVLGARYAAANGLHSPAGMRDENCRTCRVPYPCPTVRTLDGHASDGDTP